MIPHPFAPDVLVSSELPSCVRTAGTGKLVVISSLPDSPFTRACRARHPEPHYEPTALSWADLVPPRPAPAPIAGDPARAVPELYAQIGGGR